MIDYEHQPCPNAPYAGADASGHHVFKRRFLVGAPTCIYCGMRKPRYEGKRKA